ncbi:MAG: family 43 glycosylhydrolase [Bacteroidota bacterium]|nr:family 43 glycosylhydrolase [Bacteroidota bacterium]
MKMENTPIKSGDMMLHSPAGTPFSFSVVIHNAWPPDSTACAFDVKGTDPQTAGPKTASYRLPDREHGTYLDLFAQLSDSFGLRRPQNRRPPPEHNFGVAYREVLTENKAPGMLYGYGDPAVLRVEENGKTGYYLVATSNDAPDSFPLLFSADLVDWAFVGYVFPRDQKPRWALDGEGISDYWAPEMHKVNGEYRIYFVAREKESGDLCIGLARAHNPSGPYVADERPLLRGNVIDPHLFVEANGIAYLYWKEDNNEVWPRLLLDLLYEQPSLVSELFANREDGATASFILTLWPWIRLLEPMERFQAVQVFIEAVIEGYAGFYGQLKALRKDQPTAVQAKIDSVLHYMKTPMFAQPLSADGSFLTGERVKIIENDLAWEAHLVEGMWVTRQGAKYYLFYAGNDFSTTQYGVGVAIADTPLGPYRKMEKQLLQSTATWWAPGHPSLTEDLSEQPQLFLHAYSPGRAGYKQFRALLSVPVLFKENKVVVK